MLRPSGFLALVEGQLEKRLTREAIDQLRPRLKKRIVVTADGVAVLNHAGELIHGNSQRLVDRLVAEVVVGAGEFDRLEKAPITDEQMAEKLASGIANGLY